MTEYILDVYPKKAQFITNEVIEIALELKNPTEEIKNLIIELKVTRLIEVVESTNCNIRLEPGESKNLTIPLTPKNVDFEGYGIDIALYMDECLVQECSSSFDVVSDWRKATRYGFLSDFNAQDKGDVEDVKSLCKFHLNLVQFYDWMYRHDDLVPPTPEFTDLMGRKLNLDVVKEKIAFCHDYGMKAIAYGAIYAASTDFYNFDGIHMDTYGFPKTALSGLGGEEKVERLDELFPVLINNTRKELEQVNPDVCLIFNNVGNWQVDAVADAEQNAVYVEVWEPYEKYHHIQQIIQWARYLGKGKPVILAAYLKPFK